MLVHIMLFQRSLRLSSHLFTLFLHSVLWQWFLPFCLPGYSSDLLPQLLSYWFLSVYFFFSVIVLLIFLFFSYSRSLLNISCIFSVLASILFPISWIIFTIIILKSFSRRCLSPFNIVFCFVFWGFILFLLLGHILLPFHSVWLSLIVDSILQATGL